MSTNAALVKSVLYYCQLQNASTLLFQNKQNPFHFQVEVAYMD